MSAIRRNGSKYPIHRRLPANMYRTRGRNEISRIKRAFHFSSAFQQATVPLHTREYKDAFDAPTSSPSSPPFNHSSCCEYPTQLSRATIPFSDVVTIMPASRARCKWRPHKCYAVHSRRLPPFVLSFNP
jgi:hypothetical protein